MRELPGRRLTLTRGALAAMLAVLVCLTVTCAYLYARNTAAAVEGEARRGMQRTAEQMASNLNYRLRQTADSARTLMGTVYPYLNSDSGLDEQLREYSEISRVLTEYVGKYMISRVRLYVPGEKIYARQRETFFSLDTLEADTGIEDLLGDRRGGVIWQGSHQVKLPMVDIGMMGDETFWAISCVSVVTGRRNYDQRVGALFLDVSVEQIRLLLDEGGEDGVQWLLADGGGRILVGPEVGSTGQSCLTPDTLEQAKKGAGTAAEEGLLVAFAPVEECGWHLVGRVDRSRVYQPGAAMGLLITLLAATVLVALVIAMMVAYNAMLSRSLQAVNQAVAALDEDAGRDLPARMDALAHLRSSAGKLVSAAQNVVEERYQNKLAISEYQMQALQAQIKPHFLYNTLDVIKWMMVEGDQQGAVWMINALSKYLRLSINKGPSVVTIQEEMELTRSYLGLMQRRFQGSFTVKWELEQEAMAFALPRFSLQPLAENALVHGLIYCQKEDKRLTLRAFLEEDMVGIEIEDNGQGMPEEVRSRLERAEPGQGPGYGVGNVIRRLAIFGDGRSRVSIASRQGMGTCVTIMLPALRGDAMASGTHN